MAIESTLDNHGKRIRYLEGLEGEVTATRGFVWMILNPIIQSYGQIYLLWDCTVIGIYANIEPDTAAWVEFNVEERATLGAPGTNVMAVDMQADPSGEIRTSGFSNADLTEGNHLTLDVSGVEGNVSCITVTMAVRV